MNGISVIAGTLRIMEVEEIHGVESIKPPKYNGYNCEQDNGFYEMLIKRNPYIFKSSTKVMNAVFECLISPDSPIQNSITIPTLVFKTLQDRYFSKEYFDSYFSSSNCKKS